MFKMLGWHSDGRPLAYNTVTDKFHLGDTTEPPITAKQVIEYDAADQIKWYSEAQRVLAIQYLSGAGPAIEAAAAKRKSRNQMVAAGVSVLLLLFAWSRCSPSATTSESPTASTAPSAPSAVAPEPPVTQPTAPAPEPTQPEPAPQVNPAEQTVEYKLGLLDEGGRVTAGDPTVTRFRYLLDEIGSATGETDARIGDMTVAGQGILRSKYGRKVSLLSLMEQAKKELAATAGDDYARAVTDVVVSLGTQ
jgi:hypothetical protein